METLLLTTGGSGSADEADPDATTGEHGTHDNQRSGTERNVTNQTDRAVIGVGAGSS